MRAPGTVSIAKQNPSQGVGIEVEVCLNLVFISLSVEERSSVYDTMAKVRSEVSAFSSVGVRFQASPPIGFQDRRSGASIASKLILRQGIPPATAEMLHLPSVRPQIPIIRDHIPLFEGIRRVRLPTGCLRAS